MSVSIKVLLKENKQNKEGLYPLYVRVTKDRITKFISLGIYLKKEHWDDIEKKVKKAVPNSVRINHQISTKKNEIEGKAVDWDTQNKSIRNKSLRNEINKSNNESFIDFMDEYIKKLKENNQFGTHEKYLATRSKLIKFKKSSNILFEEIDIDFLKKFETHLKVKLENKINTIHGTLKILRRLFNNAIEEEVITFESNPFSKFKLKTEKTVKEYLTEDEISKLEAIDLSNKPRLSDTRNIFILACYTGGIRVSDLLQLKWNNYSETHLIFQQQKTKEQNNISIPAKGIAIINCYIGITDAEKTNYIFPFLKNDIQNNEEAIFNSISSFTAYLNKNLKELAELSEIEKNLSMHVSRHTWATRALRKGMRIEYVSKIMGHSSMKTTQVYTKIISTELDKAMEVFND